MNTRLFAILRFSLWLLVFGAARSGVPIRMPLVTKGPRESKGIEFLFTVIPARSSASFMRSRIVRAHEICWSGAAFAVMRMTTASPETDSVSRSLAVLRSRCARLAIVGKRWRSCRSYSYPLSRSAPWI